MSSITSITLSLREAALGASISHGIVARIQGFPTQSGDGDLPYFAEVVIPAAPQDGLTVTVAPGRYRVQAILPSGEILQEDAKIEDGQSVSIVFAPSASAHPWLGWQNFGGNLKPAASPIQPTVADATNPDRAPVAGRPRSPLDSLRNMFGMSRIWRTERQSERNVDEDEDTWRGVPGAVDLAPSLTIHRQSATSGEDAWAAAANAQHADELSAIWRDGQDFVRSQGAGQDGTLSLWKLDWTFPQENPPRLWAFANVADVIEVASVPLPWATGDIEPVASSVEVLVDGTPGDLPVRTSMVVRDTVLGGMLAYLAHGRLASARQLIQTLSRDNLIEQTIAGKWKNPLAACAAAYVGLAIYEPEEAERWDRWLPNIMDGFPWLPDGAIVHARRIILRPGRREETDAALAALKEAYRRGIPYFAAGVLGLRDSLSLFRERDGEARDMLENVRKVASRLDTGQAFTVLSFPKV
jgi:hypothetical protein